MFILYVLKSCPYCNNAIQMLHDNKYKYKTIVVNNDEEEKKIYKKINDMKTFPQIFLQVNNDSFIKIGGYNDLIETINQCNNIKESNTSIESIYYTYKNIFK